ncbi:hypothetical protein FWK35_00032497 [Aphis craccivora]|uniref:Uncharacterized protein n=1 Tax=Aphis craccivora TaxID=307492 RepID=A0A6G0Y340_APHCR|nr:hypothetical protein FWK35_00032497 [Aphis craccivora]
MMCNVYIFLSVYCSLTSQNNASISNIRGSFRRKNEYRLYIIKVKI